jgi:hypothetical protein
MAKINRAALRRAKAKLRKQAKNGDESAEAILNRRRERINSRREAVAESDYERPIENIAFNFSPGELVSLKSRKAGRYGIEPDHFYLVIGMIEENRYYNRTETNGWLEITGPAGVMTVRSADVKKISN